MFAGEGAESEQGVARDEHSYRGNAREMENFYHGFVLGLLVELKERYNIHFNRKSGFGRYDVKFIPNFAELEVV